MENKNESHPRHVKSSMRLKGVLVYVVVLFLIYTIKFLVEDRCAILVCESASWSKIQEIVIDNRNSWGQEYTLSDIPLHIRASDNNGLSRSKLLENVEISIRYISTQQTAAFDKTVPAERVIEFDDKNLWITSHKSSSVLNDSLPPEDILNRFKRVSLGYRDVINLTWDKAEDALSLKIQYISIGLSLSDNGQIKSGVESVWYIMYGDGDTFVEYWIDAQRGKIILQR